MINKIKTWILSYKFTILIVLLVAFFLVSAYVINIGSVNYRSLLGLATNCSCDNCGERSQTRSNYNGKIPYSPCDNIYKDETRPISFWRRVVYPKPQSYFASQISTLKEDDRHIPEAIIEFANELVPVKIAEALCACASPDAIESELLSQIVEFDRLISLLKADGFPATLIRSGWKAKLQWQKTLNWWSIHHPAECERSEYQKPLSQ